MKHQQNEKYTNELEKLKETEEMFIKFYELRKDLLPSSVNVYLHKIHN